VIWLALVKNYKTTKTTTQVLADLAQECGKYGMVLGLKVPRPPPGTAAGMIGTGNFGKVRVRDKPLVW
jgi:hypothetical protein